jgi:predicted Fe-S protein YdhL (DUF1289 family)
MGGVCSTYDDKESCTGGKTRKKVNTWKSRSRREDNTLYALLLGKRDI